MKACSQLKMKSIFTVHSACCADSLAKKTKYEPMAAP